ncbi:hypothetical protein GCM10010909_16660 [Acidocella aquatica]|uniref:Uncharacterized protein n=1 Tax=Acidocella aquatica TaxID=1922313 RepID=A0ABQ6A563_9PROT|nr:hypothetical protein GCM10010909_16660 [Acidocella aquatica]
MNFDNGLSPGETARQAQIVALEGCQLGGQRIRRFGFAATFLRCQRAECTGITLPAPVKQLFVNRYGDPLSASGVRFKLARIMQDCWRA